MSVLEIVLYVVIGISVLVYATNTIRKAIKQRKESKDVEKDKEPRESENKDNE